MDGPDECFAEELASFLKKYFICLFTYLFDWVLVATSGGQSIGASASASVLSMNIQD